MGNVIKVSGTKIKNQTEVFHIKKGRIGTNRGFYYFYLQNSIDSSAMMYTCFLSSAGDGLAELVDLRNVVSELGSEIDFLTDVPLETAVCIKEYERDMLPQDEHLFHDVRAEYIDLVGIDWKLVPGQKERRHTDEERVLLVGYGRNAKTSYIVVKAFSFLPLTLFVKKLVDYGNKYSISVSSERNLRLMELYVYRIRRKSEKTPEYCKSLLHNTLKETYFNFFVECFKKIDVYGYIYQDDFESIKEKYEGKATKKEVLDRHFVPYRRQRIKNKKQELLFLSSEVANISGIHTIDQYVYSLRAEEMVYYQELWFEDFVGEMICKNDISPFKLKQIDSGDTYNFFGDGKENHNREIDHLLCYEKDGNDRVIAVECKKTLSHSNVKNTNKKNVERIIKSGKQVIDAFFYIGCFINNDLLLDRSIGGVGKYKTGVLGDGLDVQRPYYVFQIEDIRSSVEKMKWFLKDIFDNW